MNKEAYVSVEVAKLLKQKGFDWKVFHFYDEEGHLKHREGDCYSLYNWNYPTKDEYGSHYCSAPTQQMACRWLREVYNIHIGVFIDIDKYAAFLDEIPATGHTSTPIEGDFISYEDAVEASLQYVLTNLI